MKQQFVSITEFPLPDSVPMETQVIADIIFSPESLMEAGRMLTAEDFTDEKCRSAWNVLRRMGKDGMLIDLPSVQGRIDRELIQKGILPKMLATGSAATAVQHFAALKDISVKRKCYVEAVQMLSETANGTTHAVELIDRAGRFAENLRKEVDTEKSTQHISDVLNDLGEQLQETQRNREEGKVLRIPTGFSLLDYLTFGGFNCGNLVILAARPSVGKTAVMLQMARAAAACGKAVNLFNLEMTNTELAQRFLFSTGLLKPLQMARGEVNWNDFEVATGQFATKPIYLNDTAHTIEDIISRITINAQAGKCDIAFIDYLGLITMGAGKTPLYQAIAETTKALKRTAKACKIPIVLLCQLNRASASEKRPPAMYDLRDSGSIEQDADIILMLEKATEDEDGKEVNIWVRKNRQGKAGEVKIEIVANETYTAFAEKNGMTSFPEVSMQPAGGEFESSDDFPF